MLEAKRNHGFGRIGGIKAPLDPRERKPQSTKDVFSYVAFALLYPRGPEYKLRTAPVISRFAHPPRHGRPAKDVHRAAEGAAHENPLRKQALLRE